MVIAFLITLCKVMETLILFFTNLIIAGILSLLELIKAFIKELIRLHKEHKEGKNKEKDSQKVTKGKFAIVFLQDSEWVPFKYYDTKEEAYISMRYFRSLPNSPQMMIQEIK